ncbi:MAG: YbaB/EbfC family nucleoid-associated protein [Tenericutes bacterium]|nr:YbaB/EbfC family nucleoid-associated protein [Mycoplasmatota bacterium]
MNIQAMMKQAQKLQKDMMNTKKQIDEMTFTSKKEFVEIVVSGDREVKSVKINKENLDGEDIEMLEDLILVCVNDAMDQIEAVTEQKMGKFTHGMPGLF